MALLSFMQDLAAEVEATLDIAPFEAYWLRTPSVRQTLADEIDALLADPPPRAAASGSTDEWQPVLTQCRALVETVVRVTAPESAAAVLWRARTTAPTLHYTVGLTDNSLDHRGVLNGFSTRYRESDLAHFVPLRIELLPVALADALPDADVVAL